MNTDPIADFLTRIRNAARMGHDAVNMPASKLKVELAKKLVAEGYIRSYEIKETPEKNMTVLKMLLKYDDNGQPIFRQLKRFSRPGLRRYFNSDNIPRILNGAGIAILTTNKGLLTDREARREGVGGELLCTVY